MRPHEIQKLLDVANDLHMNAPGTFHGSLPAFVTAWVDWEALRHRLLRTAAHAKGWLVKDAEAVLGAQRISSMDTTANMLHAITGLKPDNWPKRSREIWQSLRSIERLRHRLIHGSSSESPKLLTAATTFVLAALEDGLRTRGWLSLGSLGLAKGLQDARKPHPRSRLRHRTELERVLEREWKSADPAIDPRRAHLELALQLHFPGYRPAARAQPPRELAP